MYKKLFLFLLVWVIAIYLGAELGHATVINQKVESIASNYLGTSAPIHCVDNPPPDVADASGWVYLDDPYHNVFLDIPVCRDLNAMSAKHRKGWWTSSEITTCSGSFAIMVCMTGNADYYNMAISLMVLTHELTHFKLDSGDEHMVNCTAEANAWQVLRKFGLPARVTRAILTQVPLVVNAQPKPYNGC